MTVSSPIVAKTITTADLAEIVKAAPLGQKVSFVMKRSADSDMVKKHRVTKLANPYLGSTKTTYIVGEWAGIPIHKDRKLDKSGDDAEAGGTSYQRAMNRKLVADGEAAVFVSGEDKVNSRIGSSSLLEGKRDGTLKLDVSPDWKSTRSRYTDAKGVEIDRATLTPYFAASVLNRSEPPATLRPSLHNVVEMHTGGMVYKVAKPSRMTMADLATRLGQATTA